MKVPYYLNRENAASLCIDGVLSIPEGVIQIEEEAFAGNGDIKTVVLPDSVTVIEDGAFMHCRHLENIVFSKNLIDLGFDTFKDCDALKSVDLSACTRIMSINDSCFEGCAVLESVRLPPFLKEIRDYAFAGCTKLQKVMLSSDIEVEKTGFENTGLDSR
ncbi:leucine rich repeat-containing protein [Eubacterium limosum]|nr:leucine rich repeat-containing protein [Eubacterium limosum]